MRQLFLFSVIFAVIFLRFFATRPDFSDGQKVRITSRVLTEPVRYENVQSIRLLGLRVYLPLYPEIYYGDTIAVEGRVQDGTLQSATLVEVKATQGVLYKLRQNIVSFYQRTLPEPHSSLVAGVTLGSKASIPRDFWESLKNSGTVHVVVASGMNVTLVANFLINAFTLVWSRRRAIVFALVGIWIYSILSGFDAPIVRAAIMGSIAFSAQKLGRLNSAWRALVLSALAMLVIKPQWLIDLGFILSFVATASLLLFERRVYKKAKIIPEIVREDFSTSLAAQIGVFPILLVSFGQFNLLSPVINAIVLWTIVPITVLGMTGGIIGLMIEPVGALVLYLTYPLTFWFVGVVEVFG